MWKIDRIRKCYRCLQSTPGISFTGDVRCFCIVPSDQIEKVQMIFFGRDVQQFSDGLHLVRAKRLLTIHTRGHGSGGQSRLPGKLTLCDFHLNHSYSQSFILCLPCQTPFLSNRFVNRKLSINADKIKRPSASKCRRASIYVTSHPTHDARVHRIKHKNNCKFQSLLWDSP